MTPIPAKLPACTNWHHLEADEVIRQLGSNPAGLTSEEATRRLNSYGPNELSKPKELRPWTIFLGQFKSLIIWILIAAGIVSGLLGEAVDAFAIFAIVVLNAIIGFYQEFKAERSIAALKKMTAPWSKVLRDGKATSVPATLIVPGDLLLLEAGDLVAADSRILAAASLRCIESALTGESEAVAKNSAPTKEKEVILGDRTNMVFMGTSIATGTGRAIVVATAMDTELGRIAGLIDSAAGSHSTPLQEKLDSFGKILMWAALGVVTLLFVLGMLRGSPLLVLFMTSISLAVAAVPEGLPAVVTVALSLGVLRMARHRALVRRLAAVETLGSTSVICTDKTGTLTVGEMTVRELYVGGDRFTVSGEGYGPHGSILYQGMKPEGSQAAALLQLAAVLMACNNAHLAMEGGKWKTVGDPTEGALLAVAGKAGGDLKQTEREFPKLWEFPFDSDRKRSAMVRRMPDGSSRCFVNGAPGLLLEHCTQIYTHSGIRVLTKQDRKEILAQTSGMARQSLRMLGSAFADLAGSTSTEPTADFVEQNLVFMGLSGMYDPPRPEVRSAINRCHAAGIRVVMITGDHPETAAAIASEIGISPGSPVMSGNELETISQDEVQRRAPEIQVYARVTAQHKLRIVRALQANGAVVAMTGDGVNDAPAISGADIGIAMGKAGTEVTKQAADMIITDDDFATIVTAIEQGRGIYDNIRKTLQYLLAGNSGELLVMTVCVIVGLPAPLLPIHLLWINLVTDGLPALCLATDPIDSDVMKRPPRKREESITDPRFIKTMLLTGILTAGVSLAVYVCVLRTEPVETARTSAFTVLVFAELLRSFGARSESKPVWRISLVTNTQLLTVVAISLIIQVTSQHIPALGGFLKSSRISLPSCLALLTIGTIPLLALEALKVFQGFGRKELTKPET
jgi:Ca2+-transporting ATPase